MKHIVVTGGLGFIGLTLAHKLLTDPLNNVTVIDDLSAGVMDVEAKILLSAYKDRFNIIIGDLRDLSWYPEADEVYHLAAHIGTKGKHDEPLTVMEDNIELMQVILNVYGDTKAKIVYSSSIEVFTGMHQDVPTKEDCSIGWDNITDPRWAYSFSKFVAEMMLRYSKGRWSVARFSNVYGPRMLHDYVVRRVFERIIDGENPLKVYSPNDTRPFIYVDDVVEGLICLMNNPNADHDVFNIGANHETVIMELHEMAKEITGTHVKLLPDIDSKLEKRLPDVSKAMQMLGWFPRTSLREGLTKTWEYYDKNAR